MDEKLLEIEYGIRMKSRPGQRLHGEEPEEYVVDPFDDKYSSTSKQQKFLEDDLENRIKRRTLDTSK